VGMTEVYERGVAAFEKQGWEILEGRCHSSPQLSNTV
jgi:hypothetical protein